MDKNNLGIGINKGIFKYVGSNQKILSVGCGTGLLEAEAKKKGNSVYGLDISIDNVRKASKILDGVFLCDLEKIKRLPFKTETFDVIILGDVVEHLLEPRKMLRMIKPLLKREGYIIASIPNVANWTVRIPLLFGRFNYGGEGIVVWQHYRFFTRKTACALIEESGYLVEKVDCTTSVVNVCYDYIKRKCRRSVSVERTCQEKIREGNKQTKLNSEIFFFLKDITKSIVETIDYVITHLFMGLFAFQFIIVARKKE